jgi:LIVCS family branched-chain amino acid:cation transporter
MAIYFLTVNKTKIVSILGVVLTPFLLLSIGAIAFFGLKSGHLPEATQGASFASFRQGFFQGYQTMDLLAAFFFSSFVIKHLQTAAPNAPLRTFFKSALLGASMLSLVYLALVLLGSIYAPTLVHTAPQEMLGRIALESLGPLAAPFVCIAVILACLTTAIVLTSLFADFLRTHIAKQRIPQKLSLAVTLLIGFLISTLEFAGIAKFLGPILELIYPALIVLTLLMITQKAVQLRREAQGLRASDSAPR